MHTHFVTSGAAIRCRSNHSEYAVIFVGTPLGASEISICTLKFALPSFLSNQFWLQGLLIRHICTNWAVMLGKAPKCEAKTYKFWAVWNWFCRAQLVTQRWEILAYITHFCIFNFQVQPQGLHNHLHTENNKLASEQSLARNTVDFVDFSSLTSLVATINASLNHTEGSTGVAGK